MDRNDGPVSFFNSYHVALRKESVDRNNISANYHIRVRKVALRKESVDRNTQRRDFKALGLLSLSARRAWIEIDVFLDCIKEVLVALRKESVDRNEIPAKCLLCACASLSARRAWIEIS